VPRTKKITPEVLEQIPSLLERGLSPADIAHRVGCTLGTLRVICSKSKVSLRQSYRRSDAPKAKETSARPLVFPIRRASANHHQTMMLELPKMTAALLRQQAGAKRLSVSALAGMLLEKIVQDGLYDAVLDDGEASQQAKAEIRARHATRVAGRGDRAA